MSSFSGMAASTRSRKRRNSWWRCRPWKEAITLPVATSRAAKRDVVPLRTYHDFGARVRPVAAVGLAVSDPVLESGFSHLRTTPARAQGGLDTGPQCPVLFLQRTDPTTT